MTGNTLRVATFNANSIRMRIGIITDWLEEYSPDILCIQETKVIDLLFPQEEFAKVGYNIVFSGQKSYNGVAIASKMPFTDVSFGFNDGGQPDEARLITGVYNNIFILNTYVPQGRSLDSNMYQYKLEWFARVKKLMEGLCAPDDQLVWLGDLNIAPEPADVHSPERLKDHVCFHNDVQIAFRNALSFGLTDVFRKHNPQKGHYTFWDYRVRDALNRGIGWRIDHILATLPMAERCIASGIDVLPRRKPKPSDHTFLWADFEL